MPSSPTIPSPRTFLTNIFSPLSPQQEEPSAPPPPSLKPILLTLHILFPNDLLPALDLLDRNLITKFIVQDPQPPVSTTNIQPPGLPPGTTEKNPESNSPPKTNLSPPQPTPAETPNTRSSTTPLYYVTSSQTQNPLNPRHGPPESQPPPHYEVRPTAWNCSCPAFTFSAFPTTDSSPIPRPNPSRHHPTHHQTPSVSNWKSEEETWEFGGLSIGGESPMCKHLLACIMVERWKGFGGNVEVREVSIEELAGWAAGWGG
ncbi:hypothetical protein E6O75_ATG07526 [Venturia nashicola]|uniref:SWIM-type domain-containing protein n=1 Tax=Venturia nashicola TaxID=86259 RepID=A0A4Z1PDX4_9PEZI|nr:hypothetical protein E6O75_ATG07526 [Venturia nashicola]